MTMAMTMETTTAEDDGDDDGDGDDDDDDDDDDDTFLPAWYRGALQHDDNYCGDDDGDDDDDDDTCLFARRLIYILTHMLHACMHCPLTHAWTPHSCMGADAAGVSAVCFNPVL